MDFAAKWSSNVNVGNIVFISWSVPSSNAASQLVEGRAEWIDAHLKGFN